jgi:polyhydroxyalkanoate synthesis regulator phasin
MDRVAKLNALDEELLHALARPEQLDDGWLERRLAERAGLLQEVIAEGTISADQARSLVDRSRELKRQAERTRALLAEKMAALQKGKRSTRAYNQIKQQE